MAAGEWLAAVVLVVVCVVAASAASPALAQRPHIERLVQLSGASPFPGPCGASAIAQRDAEVEPSIAVDPRSSRRIVAAWIQDDGRSNLVMASRDGGRSWARVLVPGLTDCTGGAVSAAADPWLSFAGDGRLLLSSGTANLPHLPGPSFGPEPSQVVSRSRDGGLSWSLPATVQFAPGVYSDKSAVTADPLRRGRAYDAWTVRTGPDEDTGSAWFSRSSDGGRTWSPPQFVYDPGKEHVAPFGNVVAVLPHRVLLYLMTVEDDASNTEDVMAARSVDGGRTWSRPGQIAHANFNSAVDPSSGTEAGGTPGDALVTVGPDGVPTVAWHDPPRRTPRASSSRAPGTAGATGAAPLSSQTSAAKRSRPAWRRPETAPLASPGTTTVATRAARPRGRSTSGLPSRATAGAAGGAATSPGPST